MPRAQLLIEGFRPAELRELATRTSLLPLLTGKPVAVSYGRSTLLGGIRKKGVTLIIEVAVLERGAERALPMLEALARELGGMKGVRKIEWRLPEKPPRVERLSSGATESRARA